MGRIFKLTDSEEAKARIFRRHHKNEGCLVKGFLGRTRREKQSNGPLYSYIFREKTGGSIEKIIECNFCKESQNLSE